MCGIGFRLRPCDIETEDYLSTARKLSQCLRQLSPTILARIRMDSEMCEDLRDAYPRAKAVNDIGFNKKSVFLYLDYTGGFHALGEIKKILFKKKEESQKAFSALIKAKETFEQLGFELTLLTKDETEKLFGNYDNAVLSDTSIETGIKSIGVVRLLKAPFQEFHLNQWFNALASIHGNYSLHVSFRRLDEARAKMLLERRLKQYQSGKDISSQAQGELTQEFILDNFQTGSQVFEIEVLLTIESQAKQYFQKDLKDALSSLSLFSESAVETYGVAPSFAATLPGSAQHVPFLESGEALSALYLFG